MAARIVAARRRADLVIVELAPQALSRADRSAKPSGSRTRAMSAARWWGAKGVSSQPRPGRIACADQQVQLFSSAQTSRFRLTRRLLVTDTDDPRRMLPDCNRSSDGRHQSALPKASAPLACQRSCHVWPG